MKKHTKKYWKILLSMILIAAAGNLAGCLPRFCDWYTDHIYCYIEGGISRLTAPAPVAVGELLMYLGVILVVLAVLFLILLLFLRKKQGFRRFCRSYYKSFLMSLVCVVFVYTFFWVIPFRGTVLGKGEQHQRTEFTFDEIRALTLYAANGVNAAADEITIAENGSVTFPSVAENEPKIAAAMQALSGDFPRLNGYYPPVSRHGTNTLRRPICRFWMRTSFRITRGIIKRTKQIFSASLHCLSRRIRICGSAVFTICSAICRTAI